MDADENGERSKIQLAVPALFLTANENSWLKNVNFDTAIRMMTSRGILTASTSLEQPNHFRWRRRVSGEAVLLKLGAPRLMLEQTFAQCCDRSVPRSEKPKGSW